MMKQNRSLKMKKVFKRGSTGLAAVLVLAMSVAAAQAESFMDTGGYSDTATAEQVYAGENTFQPAGASLRITDISGLTDSGFSNLENQNYDQAKDDFQKAIGQIELQTDRSADYYRAYYGLGQVNMQKKRLFSRYKQLSVSYRCVNRSTF
jgi:hypothetical protein